MGVECASIEYYSMYSENEGREAGSLNELYKGTNLFMAEWRPSIRCMSFPFSKSGVARSVRMASAPPIKGNKCR